MERKKRNKAAEKSVKARLKKNPSKGVSYSRIGRCGGRILGCLFHQTVRS